MTKPILILVTGANQGIGYYVARHLAATGNYKVLMGARSLSKATSAIEKMLDEEKRISPSLLEPLILDLTKDESIAAAAKEVETKYGSLDILVNNAAIAGGEFDSTTTLRQTMQTLYDTNVTGTVVVTEAFLPLIKKSTAPAPGRRIVFVGSKLGSMENMTKYQNLPPAYRLYSCTKAAMNMVAIHYSAFLKEENIVVRISSPGFCSTNLNGYLGHRKPEDGALDIVSASTEGGMEASGTFTEDGEVVPW